jgi:hypothetical protein
MLVDLLSNPTFQWCRLSVLSQSGTKPRGFTEQIERAGSYLTGEWARLKLTASREGTGTHARNEQDETSMGMKA